MSKSFKVAIAQINTIVGDFEGNYKKHLAFIENAKSQGVKLVIFPELSLVGYIPRDILLEPHFLSRQNHYLHLLQNSIADIYVLVGVVTSNPTGVEKPFFNSALCLHNKQVIFQYDKKLLPTYGVFDERRYFERGQKDGNFEIEGVKIGFSICEDMWQHTHSVSESCYRQDPIHDLIDRKPDLMVNMSGSPYYIDKIGVRRKIIQTIVEQTKCPMVYVNQAGANDSIIFDGYSLFVTPSGHVSYALGFNEELKIIDVFKEQSLCEAPDFSFDLERALTLGIRDYVKKNGFHHVIVGLSGGIDSALVLSLCVEALGASNVKAVYMPSLHSREISYKIASQIALNFDVSLDIVPINRLVEAYIQSLDRPLGISQGGITFENIQSRIRGNILMAYANRHSALMMGCSNKSELAVGYGTLYGDIAGALLPIGDLLKVEVYKLARQISRGRLPEEVFTRAPSAELYMNQQDIDTLPPYEILDPILKMYLEHKKSRDEILNAHPEFAPHVDHILHLLKISEFKRYQAPMVLKVSKRNFGTGWDFPITRH